MKKIKLSLSFLICFVLILSSCGKNSSTLTKMQKTSAITTTQNAPIKLGQAENFVIFASSSISSIPNSTINGKIGLEPGIRSQINLLPSEVVGGSSDIYAADDTNPDSHLLLEDAHTDLEAAAKEIENRKADSDKIGKFNGFLGGKTLTAGSYKWNSRVTINSDLILEGAPGDVWIFHVSANFNMANDVRVILSGGARAKNVFWLVDGSLRLADRSEIVGTVIVQKIFTMQSLATLNGRAFSLKGNLVLDNNTITKPE
ncbi:MAG: ice-binding family protein [Bacteriovorax sp.]|nr:ice-binding family protein [Bacteriovorax sp.]